MTQPEAGASVPNLRAKQPILRLLLVVAALALVAGGFVIYRMFQESRDPGAAACDRIAELAKQDPASWHDLVEAIIGFVQGRTLDSSDDSKRIIVEGVGDDARCRAVFSGMSRTMPYSRFGPLVDCMSDITTREGARDCFKVAYLDRH